MGGNKSKPAADSARSVLTRRAQKVDPPIVKAAENAASPSVSVTQPSFEVDSQPEVKNIDLDPAILSEISKWSMVRSSHLPPKQMVTKGEPSAAIIRLNERKEREGLTAAELKEKNAGRLTEEEALELLTKLRANPSQENITKLATQYRAPIIELSDPEGSVQTDYPTAR